MWDPFEGDEKLMFWAYRASSSSNDSYDGNDSRLSVQNRKYESILEYDERVQKEKIEALCNHRRNTYKQLLKEADDIEKNIEDPQLSFDKHDNMDKYIDIMNDAIDYINEFLNVANKSTKAARFIPEAESDRNECVLRHNAMRQRLVLEGGSIQTSDISLPEENSYVHQPLFDAGNDGRHTSETEENRPIQMSDISPPIVTTSQYSPHPPPATNPPPPIPPITEHYPEYELRHTTTRTILHNKVIMNKNNGAEFPLGFWECQRLGCYFVGSPFNRSCEHCIVREQVVSRSTTNVFRDRLFRPSDLNRAVSVDFHMKTVTLRPNKCGRGGSICIYAYVLQLYEWSLDLNQYMNALVRRRNQRDTWRTKCMSGTLTDMSKNSVSFSPLCVSDESGEIEWITHWTLHLHPVLGYKHVYRSNDGTLEDMVDVVRQTLLGRLQVYGNMYRPCESVVCYDNEAGGDGGKEGGGGGGGSKGGSSSRSGKKGGWKVGIFLLRRVDNNSVSEHEFYTTCYDSAALSKFSGGKWRTRHDPNVIGVVKVKKNGQQEWALENESVNGGSIGGKVNGGSVGGNVNNSTSERVVVNEKVNNSTSERVVVDEKKGKVQRKEKNATTEFTYDELPQQVKDDIPTTILDTYRIQGVYKHDKTYKVIIHLVNMEGNVKDPLFGKYLIYYFYQCPLMYNNDVSRYKEEMFLPLHKATKLENKTEQQREILRLHEAWKERYQRHIDAKMACYYDYDGRKKYFNS